MSGVERPRAGRDYPATFQQLQGWFPDDQACVDYLARLRWPDGFVCPACGFRDAWRTKAGLWMCSGCERKTSVTAGTVFHRSRLHLPTWFAAIWVVTSQKNGVSALGLQQVLGLGSYETAWALLHKLRRAMVRPDRDRLSGLVEVDETFFGATLILPDRRRVSSGTSVIVAVEMLEDDHRLGRIRLGRLPEPTRRHATDFIHRSIEPGTTLRTDGRNLYDRIAEDGYIHHPINVRASGDPAHVWLPGVHRVSSLLKRWVAGTLQHSVSHKHLDYYLDEFTFRFNRRNSRARGLLFYRLLEQAVATDPHPYRELVRGTHNI